MGSGQLLLVQTGQKIGLVLLFVGSLAQQIPAVFRMNAHAGVMSRCDAVITQFPGAVQKPAELQMPVTLNAGVGGQSTLITVNKVIYNLTAKSVFCVQNMKLHAHPLRHSPGVLLCAGCACVPQIHDGTAAGEAFLLHQMGCHRAVHTAAHGDQDSCVHAVTSFLFVEILS